MSKKPVIALVAGGYTGEKVISLKSAKTVFDHLDKERFEVVQVLIDQEGWRDDLGNVVDRNDFSVVRNGQKKTFDLAFIIVHGTPGEDGKLQGYFDLLGIPYTTCNAATSAITMNKAYTKSIIAHLDDLFVARSVQAFIDKKSAAVKRTQGLSLPLFVKPNTGGSSIGMSKVTDRSEVSDALDKAFKEDVEVIVEEFIKGSEYTVGVVRLDGKVQVLPITEIISSKEFFDYEAKYTPGISQEITPARLSAEETTVIGRIVKEIYETLNCNGVVRIDFILQETTRHFYFLEINTVPGQSENSIIPQQVKALNWTLQGFYGKLIEEVLNA